MGSYKNSAAKVLLFCDIYNSKKSLFVSNMSLFEEIVHFFDEKEAFGVDFQGQKRTIKHAKKKNANLVEIDVDQEIFEMIYSTLVLMR